MEQLPTDIEQKIENLPIIALDAGGEFQNLIFSQEFTDIFNFYKENYLPDVLKTKPELYQRVSLYLTLTNQDTSFIEQTDNVLYRRPCPTIKEFLDNKFYMGYSNATLYPYWKEQLKLMFKEGSPVRKVIFSGCLGCLTKDTKIATLSGDKTIGELLNNFGNEWVLSYNSANNSWEPDKILDVFYSGYKDIYEITLDNGEIIKCTDNHKFLSRKNKWVSIKDNTLVPGLSMMPYYTRYNKSGYLQVKNNETEKWESRYVTVGKWKSKYEKGIAIHHKNYNKLDDRPTNLCLLTVKQHYMFHAKKGGDNWKNYNQSISGEEFKELRRKKVLKGRDTYRSRPDYPEKKAIRVKWWKETMLTKEHQQKAAYAVWHGKNAEQNKLQSAQRITLRNKTEKARNTSKRMAANMRKLKRQKTPEELEIICAKQGLSSLKRHKGINSKEYQEKLAFIRKKEPWYNPELGAKANHKLKKTYNHKIVSIKYLGKEDVYDITTERNHNFALTAGIVAHNCGKSTVARKAFLYVLYRIMCLRYPRSTFNVDADATIANVVIATTLKQVYDVNMLPFVKLMETMPCFQRVMSQRSFENFNLDDPHCPIPFVLEKSSGTVYFPDNIILTSGSQATHFTGMNVVNSFCFTGNMKVYTDKGIISFISLLRQFKKGIKFNTYCLDRNGIKQKVKILDVQETRKVTELIRIYYDDERYIECTPDHPFIINNPKKDDKYIIYENGIAYKQAQYLTEEDDIASEKHRKRTAELNHLFPKVSSKESRTKLAKSQSLSWNKKTIEEKAKANIAKSLGGAWNVLKRIKNDQINEQIFNSHRSKGSRLANTEPLWKTIITKVGGIEAFLLQIEKRFGRKFIYED